MTSNSYRISIEPEEPRHPIHELVASEKVGSLIHISYDHDRSSVEQDAALARAVYELEIPAFLATHGGFPEWASSAIGVPQRGWHPIGACFPPLGEGVSSEYLLKAMSENIMVLRHFGEGLDPLLSEIFADAMPHSVAQNIAYVLGEEAVFVEELVLSSPYSAPPEYVLLWGRAPDIQQALSCDCDVADAKTWFHKKVNTIRRRANGRGWRIIIEHAPANAKSRGVIFDRVVDATTSYELVGVLSPLGILPLDLIEGLRAELRKYVVPGVYHLDLN